MDKNQITIQELLIKKGSTILKDAIFSEDPKENQIIKNIDKDPHFFVIYCMLQRNVRSSKTKKVILELSNNFGISFSKISNIAQEEFINLFRTKKLHRFWKKTAINIHLALQKIKKDYNGLASKIWEDIPSSCAVVRRFLEFKGVSTKIATMACNSLVRDFKISLKDKNCIDISPDAHVCRVFERIGFVRLNSSKEEVLYKAREMNPEYPGVFDNPCWNIGKSWCKPNKPICKLCYLEKLCPKIINKPLV